MSEPPSFEPPDDVWRSLAEGSSDGLVVLDEARSIRWCSGRFAALLGHASASELVGRPFAELVHPEDREGWLASLKGPVGSRRTLQREAEDRLLLRDGTTLAASIVRIALELQGEPAIALAVRDVSQERRRRARLAQADRMASLGALAAGVAHEINNPLTYVLLRLGAVGAATRKLRPQIAAARALLEKRLGPEDLAELGQDTPNAELLDEIAGHVETATEGAARVRKIVNDLRVFARDDDDEVREAIELERPLELALGMATHELKHRATIVREYARIPAALASESGLAQVFLNLLLNAAEAIPEGQPVHHRIVLRTGQEADRVYAVVSDTGRGIAPEDLTRIFEPFYASGEGPSGGLGLAICHGIVRSLGGSIRVASRPGEGASFTVLLPIAPPTPKSEPPQTSSSGSPRT
jgi:two-component system, cell cycle sensor histidine kinase and response regulator CckA